MKKEKNDCCYLFIIGIIIVMCLLIYFYHCLCEESLVDIITSASTAGTMLVATISACYAYHEYLQHQKNEKTQLLCHYNHRYSTDANIKAVVEWMLDNTPAITPSSSANSGDINGCLSPTKGFVSLYQKEMFMRFFEELNIQIKEGNLDKQQVKDLFSYYAIKFGKIDGFRENVTDYDTNWSNFKSFVNLMDSDCKNENDSK